MTSPALGRYQKMMAKILVKHINRRTDWGACDCDCGFGPITTQEWSEHVMREVYRELGITDGDPP